MRILSCVAQNFGSYQDLTFNFEKLGFTLIEGPTGSGKSTLCDLVPWALFGRTAKNGLADEVLSWHKKGDTQVAAVLEKNGKEITIVRRRGKQSDLYLIIDGEQVRGKDTNDTQRLINEILNITLESYLAGSYFHEFSQTAQFFTTSSKNRRVICEQIVDLSLSVRLQDKVALELKIGKKELEEFEHTLKKINLSLENANNNYIKNQQRAREWKKSTQDKLVQLKAKQANWDFEHNTALVEIKKNYDKFEDQKTIDLNKINEQLMQAYSLVFDAQTAHDLAKETYLSMDLKETICPTCNQVCKTQEHERKEQLKIKINNEEWNINKLNTQIQNLEKELKRLESSVNPFLSSLELKTLEKNTYGDQAFELMSAKNPFDQAIEEAKQDQDSALSDLEVLSKEKDVALEEYADLEKLKDILVTFRAELIKMSVELIQEKTNSFLREYFDSEFTVSFEVEKADAIEILIYKDGNNCSYTQLSKGQRGILKLCFATAVMECVSANTGNALPVLFYDEALDGLDDYFKLKAVSMLEVQSLKYDSLFLVDHSESVKAMITNKIIVKNTNGVSKICQL